MLQKQKALIIGVNLNGQPDFHESMDELHNLAIACEFTVVGRAEQNLKTANSAYYIGYGKIEEIRLLTEETEANIIIFNNELSPSQVKNLEKELDLEILDRTSLILEIFAKRAKTREAKLQVESARLKYLLPKLIGSNESLGRQSGGVGTRNRGSGEKKLELDRRKIEEKISELNKELKLLENERKTQKKMRSKTDFPSVALVGYTNAGKSTLMNAMVEFSQKSESKKVFEKDMLFATLETSVRRISLPENRTILLSDTVGFVNKLPHDLVKAFRSTLDEVRDADLLLHIIDSSHPNFRQQMEVTNETLCQIGAKTIPTIYVFNKADLTSMKIPSVDGDSVFISAKEKIGITELIQLIIRKAFSRYRECRMLIPYDQGRIVSYLNENAHIKSVSYESNGTLLDLECKEQDYQKYEEFVVQ
ncbi:MAG TPA: GTPase HflX [Leptospiraceae bacterium]|nr:GTPase HflX [Leptospiraceae bacterium]HNF15178.1 GTPase HflX [Leptospiraceae bacterium]HNF26899.1 GTPase HflX [Leptospiraceae bacterium]HNI96971.1 GTPase HflX [Leptospiraceae bacterium]HNN03382.1 GTPase HflX [Leptospiraceae bacterium]